MKFRILALAMLLIPATAYASRSMPAPECVVIGTVLKQEKRIEEGQGISTGRMLEYMDIHVDVKHISYAKEEEKEQFSGMEKPYNCDDEQKVIIYQQQLENSFGNPYSSYEGECIQAKTSFMADGNFESGDWMYHIKVLDPSVCE